MRKIIIKTVIKTKYIWLCNIERDDINNLPKNFNVNRTLIIQ